MNITNLFLSDFIHFRVSQIQEIDIDVDRDFQLIIGSNGSGKSSLLHEFFPSPWIKSSFGKSGSASLSLVHKGIEYRLTYDVNSGHCFFKNGTNLNISRTNEIQKNLIYENFGITNEIHNVLKCSLHISSMLPSMRKKILMSMNPIDIGIFLRKYQKVHKDVVAYGNNLDRLYARQKQLVSKKIPEQLYQDMLKRRNILTNQEKLLLVWITTVTSELNNLPTVTEYESSFFENTLKNARSLCQRVSDYSDVNRTNLSSVMTELNVNCRVNLQELDSICGKIESTIATINAAEIEKNIVKNDGNDAEKELLVLQAQLQTYSFEENFNPIPKEDISIINSLASSIIEILVSISYIQYKDIKDKSALQLMYNILVNAKFELDKAKSHLERLNARHLEILKTIKNYTIRPNCDGSGCDLFQIYQEHQYSKQSELNDVSMMIVDAVKNVDELTEKYNELDRVYADQLLIWKHIDKIIEIIQSDKMLKRRFDQDFILKKLNESPMSLYNDIISYIDTSERYHEYLIVERRIRELELINASVSSKKQVSIEVIENTISMQSKQLEALRSKFTEKERRIDQQKSQLSHFENFQSDQAAAHSYLDAITEAINLQSINLGRQYLSKLIEILSKMLSDIRSELIDITTICREQELLLARLDTEIDSVIQDIQPKFENAKLVEKSLADLPIKYTRTFVNDIIETANYFINEIMTYPMNLVPVDDNNAFEFGFPVMINDDVLIKDAANCSVGQKDVIDLAFNLAIVIELKFNDFPVFCDEYDRALDPVHSQRLTNMLLNLEKTGVVSQLFVVNHDKSMIEQLSHDSNVIVLDDKNIILPENYNQNVRIVRS